MLFATSRMPRQSFKSRANRKLSFDAQNTTASQNMFFCERHGENDYVEILSEPFFQRLKSLDENTQILLYIHGFNNNMEEDIFKNAETLQRLFDEHSGEGAIEVVPLIWPCDDDSAIQFLDDYWDDQRAADASGLAFGRMLGKFDGWRRGAANQADPCTKQINILAHSMGNRVLRNALKSWAEEEGNGRMPRLFRNVFMMAADVVNHTLEEGEDGRYIPDSARNVVVYYANDDFAMPASKAANLKNKTISRRMGMTGPEDLDAVPKNVYEVDCDDFNNNFDKKGHTYFMVDRDGKVSPALEHMAKAITTGRVSPNQRSYILPEN